MKKLISILLALTLALSLAVPAFAAEDTEPAGAAYKEEDNWQETLSDLERGAYDGMEAGQTEGEALGRADFDKGADYDPPAYPGDLYEVFPDGEGTYQQGYDYGVLLGRYWGYTDGYYAAYTEGYDKGKEETYQTGYDKGLADGTARTPEDPETVAPEMGPLDDFSYECGVNDGRRAGYLSGYWDGYMDAAGVSYEKDLEVYAKGGDPCGVNVMFNGVMVQFPDQKPELKDGRTMVPVRAVMESMGATVDYDHTSKTVSISLNGAVTSFTAGSSRYTVTRDGQTTSGTMDCACYNSNGRVMVPVRFLAEASGYTVIWDGHHHTAIIVDEEGMAAEIDKSFTDINSILAARLTENQGKNQESTTVFTVKNTLYDEDGKAVVFPFSGTVTSYTDGKACRVDVSLSITDALQAMLESDTGLLSNATISLRTAMTADLNNLTASLILDEEGNIYVQAPVILELLGGEPMEANQWFFLGNVNQMGVDMEELADGSMTVGTLLMRTLLTEDAAFYLTDTLEIAVPVLEAIYGDSNAQENGDGYTWNFDLASILLATGLVELTAEDLADNDFTASLTADAKGNYSMTGDWRLGGEDLVFTGSLDSSGTATSGKLSLTLALADVFELVLTAESTTRIVPTLPSLALPADAVVVDETAAGGWDTWTE